MREFNSLQFTTVGLRELTLNQRQHILVLFFDGKLGDEVTFPEYEPYIAPPIEDDYEPSEEWEMSEELADKIYEDERERRWEGLYYKRSVNSGRETKD